MSNVAHTFADLYRERQESADAIRFHDETQVNIRVGPDVVAALDALAAELAISRSAAARHIVVAGMHDALDALHFRLTMNDGAWAVEVNADGLDVPE